MKLGEARVKKDFIKLVHIINITDIETNADLIRNNIEILSKNSEKSKTLPFETVLWNKFQTLMTNLNAVKPRYRTKRGVINGLGSILKTITGNMDYHDSVTINNHIETLKLNQHDLNQQINKQININHQMISRFSNITDHINKQQRVLGSHIQNISNKLDTLQLSNIVTQYFYQLMHDIHLLNEHIENIIDSVTFAKLKIISRHILHPFEMNQIYKILIDQKVNIISDENIYQLLELQAYYNESNIIFIIQIPNFYPEPFQLYHIKQLPINDTLTLEVKHPFLLLNEHELKYMDANCPIVEQVAFCDAGPPRPIIEDSCITNIIMNRKAHCTLVEGKFEEKIELVQPNHLLIISGQEINIGTSCNSNINHSTLKGIFLIRFDNCTINIKNIKYSSQSTIFWDSIHIVSTLFENINHTKIVKNITFAQLSDWTFKNSEAITLLSHHRDTYDTSHYQGRILHHQ